MKLLYFIPLLSTVGGQERTLIDKANYLVAKGHEVIFVTYEHDGPIAYQMNSKIQHVDLQCHFFTLYKYPIYRRITEALKLKRDFCHEMQEILSVFSPDLIVVAIPNTENFICELMSLAKDIPVIIESHLAQGYEVIKRGVTEKWFYYVYNPLKAIKKARLLIALTKGDAKRWQKLHVEQIMVIPNPVTIYLDKLPQAEKQEGRIICVGRLTRQKRFDRLVNAFSLIAPKYPNWHVDIFGKGEEEQNLLQQINDLGLKKCVQILPPTSNIYSEYQRSQFFVMSSDFEGFGLVIVEAMACGIPVIATNCPFGPSEIIEDGVTGLLSKMDTNDLAEKMEWMITHNEERKAMGVKAYTSAARFRKEIIIPEWEKAYISVIV